MKKFLAALALLCAPLFAQIDVKPGTIGPYITLTRNATWGGTNTGGANNGFVYTPVNPGSGVCFFATNRNPTSAHSFALQLFTNGDTQANGYYADGTSSRWIQAASINANTSASGTFQWFFQPNASSRIEFVITGGTTQAGSPDTVDFYIVQSNSGCPLTSQLSGQGTSSGSIDGYQGPRPIIACDNTATIKVATGTTVNLITSAVGGAGNFRARICAFSISGPVTVSSADIIFVSSGTTGCPSGTQNLWTITAGASDIPKYNLAGANFLFAGQANQYVCVTNAGTGSTVTVSADFEVSQ